jgi:hypothetical protein
VLDELGGLTVMKRLSSAAASLAILGSLLLGAPASAGNAATITVAPTALGPIAGQPYRLDLEILQHGQTPIDWEQVSLVARSAATGHVTAANGRADGVVGHYVIDVTFPVAGAWVYDLALRDLLVIDATPVSVIVAEADRALAPAPDPNLAGTPSCT